MSTEKERMIALEKDVSHILEWFEALKNTFETGINEIKKKLEGLGVAELRTEIEVLKIQMKIVAFVWSAIWSACIGAIVYLWFH